LIGNARNVLIVLALAAGVWAIPGGGDAAAVALAVLTTIIFVGIVLLAVRFYRENRIAIYSLGDRYRALLYASIGTIVVASAALDRFRDAGVLIWLGAMGAALFGLYRVWLHHREYGY
jgi:hypothetical protein